MTSVRKNIDKKWICGYCTRRINRLHYFNVVRTELLSYRTVAYNIPVRQKIFGSPKRWYCTVCTKVRFVKTLDANTVVKFEIWS
jgi:hypothetical protein